MLKRSLAILVLLALLTQLVPGGLFQTSGVEAQELDSDSKISSLLALQVQAKLQAVKGDGLSAASGASNQTEPFDIRQLPGIRLEDLNNQQIFIHFGEPPTQSQIAELEADNVTLYLNSWLPPAGNHPTGFMLADMPLDKLETLAEKGYIVRLETAERQLQPQNDLGTQKINVPAVWASGYNGTGVRIAVLDSGLDLTHPDFPTPVAKKDYSSYPIVDDTIANTVSGHGTHVTGSVLGRGTQSSGVYKGSAPGADLIFLKIGNDTNAGASTPAIVNAIRAATDTYSADIITMSYGGWDAYHDGTSEESQAVDYAVSRGAVVLIAAGNSANDNEHYSGTVAAGSTTDYIPINVTGASSTDTTLWFNSVWYDGTATSNNLSIQFYDSAQVIKPTVNEAQRQSTRGTEARMGYIGPSQGSHYAAPSGTYYVKVTNSSPNQQLFHLYVYTSGVGSVTFPNADPYYTITSPADADSAIAVGAYTTRKVWYDYANKGWQSTAETVDQIATFSSRGPRVDTGAPGKPNIVAPGKNIISARDNVVYPWANRGPYYVDNDGPNANNATKNNGAGPADYYVMGGTSMATPIAAGVAALILQKNPGWTPAQVKNALESTATDKGTASWDSTYGWGLINALAALSEPPAVTTNAADNITTTSVRLSGNLTSLGTATSVNVSFQWGLNSGNYTNETTSVSMNSTGNFSASISSLSSNTTYYFRSKAVGDWTGYGAEKSFSTLALAPPPPFLLKWWASGSGDWQYTSPQGVAVDASGNVYVATGEGSRIQKFASDGTAITKWGTAGSGDSQFQGAEGVAVDASGNVYVADTYNHRLQKFTSSGTFITKWGTQGSGDSQFAFPRGVAVDTSGNVYVADTVNHRLQKFTGSGTFITKWGTQGSGDSQFQGAVGVAVDASGNVYVIDSSNYRLQKFTSSGTFITMWGTFGSGDSQFGDAVGVAVDASGNVYVADTGNNRLQKFTSQGELLTKWGSSGTGDGQFQNPRYVAVDAWGNVYVADTYNHRLQVFGYTIPPSVTTNAADNITAGSATLKGSLDSRGSYSSANVSFQWGLSSGNYTGTTPTVSMNTTGNFSAVISNLSSNTTYYFKAKAVGDNMTVSGSEVSFVTKTLVSIAVTPDNPLLLPSRTQQFTATGTASDNSTENLTSAVTWSSSNTSVATINATGLATALAAGSTTITAALGGVSDNTTLSVTASVEVNSGERLTLATNESRGNVPLTIKGIPDSGNGTGVSAFTFNLSWNKDVIRVDNVTAATIAGFSLAAGAPNNTTGSANITGNTSGSYLVGNITVANLGISAVGTAGNSTSINITITQLLNHNLNPISATAVNATVAIIDLMAETSIAQGLSSNTTGVVVVKVNINRIKNPSDNSTANIPGGIGSYTATVSGNDSSIIQFLAVNGVPPFNSPSFNATSGVFSVASISSPIQPSNTTVAEVVPLLTGNTTAANITLTITFQAIGAAGQPGLTVPEERSNSITLRRGDADGNGVVSIVDSLVIKQYLVGQLTLTQINPLNAASPKHDGAGGDKIGVVDALAIEQFLVGQINTYFE